MKAGCDTGKTGEESIGIHACPARHIETRLDIDTVGCGMQDKQLKMMRDCRLGREIGWPPSGGEPRQGSQQ